MTRMTGNVFIRSFGELRRRRALLVIAVFGGLIAYAVVAHVGAPAMSRMGTYQYWTILSGMLGAGIAYRTGEGHLGLPGWKGGIRAVAAGVWITLAGAAIGGTLALPFYGTMFGPLLVIVTMIEVPALFALWCIALLGAHKIMYDLRYEVPY